MSKTSILALLLLLSFAPVNAVLFTPALPEMARIFAISSETTQQTISLFLVGFTLGPLIYGPLANRFGRKPALYAGVFLQLLGCVLCVMAGIANHFPLLLLGCFILALGASVGTAMTITLVTEYYGAKEATRFLSFLALSLALTPGLSVALGGVLTTYYGWVSCFYASACYGLILLLLLLRLPETLQGPGDIHALKLKILLQRYSAQFKNKSIIAGGLLLGCTTGFTYVFAAMAPFIAIDTFGMSATNYGTARLLLSIGLVAGCLLSAQLAKSYPLEKTVKNGIAISVLGVLYMGVTVMLNLSVIVFLFLPMIIIYLGNALIASNVRAITMDNTDDKANGSAVMNFLSMVLPTTILFSLELLPENYTLLLPTIYVILCAIMIRVYMWKLR